MASLREVLDLPIAQDKGTLLDLVRGGLMGVSTDVLGYPVDLATMALRPLGYNVEKPVGGSDWLADKLTSPTGTLAETAGRTLTGMVTPGPNELLKLAGMIPNTGPAVSMAGKTDYRGLHTAPTRKGGAPLHEVNRDVYPDDIYGPNAARYYGHGEPFDWESVNVIQSMRGRPDALVTVYRAVPHKATSAERLAKLEKQKASYMRRRLLPAGVNDEVKWYNDVSSEIERLKQAPLEAVEKLTINPGDWITTSRAYAKQHGEGTLRGEYKILSKKVRAKDLYTDGNSIHEWGYDPD